VIRGLVQESVWVGTHENVFVLGPTGVGKSFVACALAQKACRDGYSALYRRAQSLFRDLAMARADGSLRSLLARLGRIDVLVIDDWVMAPLAVALPTTLAMLFHEFFRQHAEEKLAPKTIERYRELAVYLAPELLAMPLAEITPLHLGREWNRLLKCGGSHRKTKQARPLSAKTVRHIAGLVSSAFARTERWGLVAKNPVTRSEPPVPKKHRGVALTPAQQALVFASATSPWCMATFLEICAATGARRGEVLALLVGHAGWSRHHNAVPHPNQAGIGIQGHEIGEATRRESAGIRARRSRNPS
jgi:hypothetical protein